MTIASHKKPQHTSQYTLKLLQILMRHYKFYHKMWQTESSITTYRHLIAPFTNTMVQVMSDLKYGAADGTNLRMPALLCPRGNTYVLQQKVNTGMTSNREVQINHKRVT